MYTCINIRSLIINCTYKYTFDQFENVPTIKFMCNTYSIQQQSSCIMDLSRVDWNASRLLLLSLYQLSKFCLVSRDWSLTMATLLFSIMNRRIQYVAIWSQASHYLGDYRWLLQHALRVLNFDEVDASAGKISKF